ncbi:MAG: PLP-dependent aminotransferase family protein [Gammaproteobacteria bacterium]|nr:PLP-dependent aminotransferase family protein [Gammaproteobacteria bacterium]
MLLNLDCHSSTPLYRQIHDQISVLIDGGQLLPDQQLPPTRTLAQRLGVNRSTVVRAYSELAAAGYVASLSGSSVRVRQRLPFANRTAAAGWLQAGSPPSVAADSGGALPFDLATLAPDPRLAPVAEWRRALAQVLARRGAELLGYGEPQGDLRLRQWLADYLRRHRIDIDAEQLLLTNGAQQALDLILRWRIRPGDRVVVESPTYAQLLPLLAAVGADVVAVPMTVEGMDLARLSTVLAERKPVLVCTMPSFHNPTGITTSQSHRERLLALCDAAQVMVVEDGFVEEMKYAGPAVPPLKALDQHQSVVYVGTLSKVMGPGLRIGYVAAHPAVIHALTELSQQTSLGGAPLLQAAAWQFCRNGWFAAYLQRLHRHYRRRLQTLLRLLDAAALPGVCYQRPSGGYLLWLTLPNSKKSEDELVDALASAGVAVRGGRRFYPEPPATVALRLSIARLDEGQITTAAAILVSVLRQSLALSGELTYEHP